MRRLLPLVSSSLTALLIGLGRTASCALTQNEQTTFSRPSGVLGAGADTGVDQWRWDAEPAPDGTSNMIFRAVSSLLQEWPNMWYRNGLPSSFMDI